MLCLGLYSCKNETPPENYQIFKCYLNSHLNSLDPAFARDLTAMNVSLQLFDALVAVDENNNIVPSLAKSWEISDDGLRYTFHLRPKVLFHEDAKVFRHNSERLVTAQDVVFSLSRITDPKTASPGAWIFADRLDEKEAFFVLNDSTFQLRLRKPFRPMLGILSMQYCGIVSQKAAKYYDIDFREHPIGTGPFYVKAWREGESIVLRRNENYWEKDTLGNAFPYLDAVKFIFSENKKQSFLAFMQGEIDYLSGIDASYKDELLEKDGSLKKSLRNNIVLHKTPYLNTEYLGFLLTEESPFRQKKIRQALNYGFDRQTMMQYLRNNIGIPATAGFVPKGLPTFAPPQPGYTYQAEKAKALLADLGYGLENPLKIRLFTTSSYKDLATFIQQQWQQIGINLSIELLPSAHLREQMSKGTATFFRASWIADYPDEESYFTVFYGKNPAPPNYTRFNSTFFDKLYEQSLQENNDSIRRSLYRKMDSMLIEEAPIIPLYYDEVMRFYSPKIHGLKDNAFNLLFLKYVYKSEE